MTEPTVWIDPSPIGQLCRELERLVQITDERAVFQAYGVAWSLAVLRCTKADDELRAAKARVTK